MFCLKEVTKKYDNGFTAIKELSLRLDEAGMVAFIGPSGAGKTTLLNLLSMNDDITSGSIEFNGIKYGYENRSDIVSEFAYIYQDYKLIENLTVEDNLKIAIELSGEDVGNVDIEKLLEKIGLDSFAHEKVLSLSAGQKQRVAIARAIIRKPKVLFADEPTGNLDSENSDNVLQLLKELSQEILVLIVTHDTERIQRYADRIIKLNDGKIERDTVLNENRTISKEKATATEKRAKLKSKLSAASTLKLSKSLNSSKKVRQLVFSGIIVLLICVSVPFMCWSFSSYEKVVVDTLNTLSDTKGMFVDVAETKNITFDKGTNTVTAKGDLTPLEEYINIKGGGKTARVININRSKRISDLYSYTTKTDKDGNLISMAAANAFYDTQYVILSDDPAEIGIKIIKGVAPKNKFEYLISSGMYDYVNAVGCIPNSVDKSDIEFIDMTGDELIGREVYGVKIVGVFDDNFTADEKYHTLRVSTADEEENKLRHNMWSNILCNSVITASATEEYYRDTYYMTARNNNAENLVAELENEEIYGFAPANDNTKSFSHVDSLKSGEILISAQTAERMGLVQGDTATFETTMRVDSEGGDTVTRTIAAQSFTVVVGGDDVDGIFLSESDFDAVTENFSIPNHMIYLYRHNITAGYLSGITNFVKETYNISRYDNGVRFTVDYGSYAYANYDTMKLLLPIPYTMLAIMAIVYFALACNIVSINVKSKANELLVLKSLGATRMQFAKVYSISMLVHIVAEFVLGCLIGWALIFGVNTIFSMFFGETYYTEIFVPFDAGSIGIMFAVIVAVNVFALAINLFKINDKNLRKSFQKTKE